MINVKPKTVRKKPKAVEVTTLMHEWADKLKRGKTVEYTADDGVRYRIKKDPVQSKITVEFKLKNADENTLWTLVNANTWSIASIGCGCSDCIADSFDREPLVWVAPVYAAITSGSKLWRLQCGHSIRTHLRNT